MNLEEFIKLQELERNKSKQRRTTSQNFNMELTHLWIQTQKKSGI